MEEKSFGDKSPVAIRVTHPKRDRLAEGEVPDELFRTSAKRLAALWRVDAVKAYAVLRSLFKNGDGVAIGDRNHLAGDNAGLGLSAGENRSGCCGSPNETREDRERSKEEPFLEIARHHRHCVQVTCQAARTRQRHLQLNTLREGESL